MSVWVVRALVAQIPEVCGGRVVPQSSFTHPFLRSCSEGEASSALDDSVQASQLSPSSTSVSLLPLYWFSIFLSKDLFKVWWFIWCFILSVWDRHFLATSSQPSLFIHDLFCLCVFFPPASPPLPLLPPPLVTKFLKMGKKSESLSLRYLSYNALQMWTLQPSTLKSEPPSTTRLWILKP